jgi:beta-lactamase class A
MAVDLLSAARPGSVTARDRAFLNGLDQGLRAEEREAYFLEYQRDPRDRATPLAMVELLVRFQRGELLSAASTALLRELMTAARSRLGAKLPGGTPVANKTGTGMGSFNDVGIVTLPDRRHLVLAVYVSGARGADQESGEALVADVARAAYDDVTGRRR